MNDLISLLSSNLNLIAASATILSFIATLISLFIKLKNKTMILSTIESLKLEKILQTDDKEILGKYLETSLEKINITQYSTNEDVSKSVDSYLKQIQSYLGKSSEIIEPIEIEKDISLKEKPDSDFSEIPEDFKPILNELNHGEPWNALARLRRYLEMFLKEFALSRNMQIEKTKSAGFLLRQLEKEKFIDPDVAGILRYVLSVCNKAIHGFDISRDDADKAIRNAIYVLFSYSKL